MTITDYSPGWSYNDVSKVLAKLCKKKGSSKTKSLNMIKTIYFIYFRHYNTYFISTYIIHMITRLASIYLLLSRNI